MKGYKQMKVKATTPMSKLINEIMAGCRVTLEKMKPEQYKITVDYDLFRNEADYNATTGLFQVVRIEYPADYYASPAYITTRDLVKVYRASDGTFDGFKRAIEREYTI